MIGNWIPTAGPESEFAGMNQKRQPSESKTKHRTLAPCTHTLCLTCHTAALKLNSAKRCTGESTFNSSCFQPILACSKKRQEHLPLCVRTAVVLHLHRKQDLIGTSCTISLALAPGTPRIHQRPRGPSSQILGGWLLIQRNFHTMQDPAGVEICRSAPKLAP